MAMRGSLEGPQGPVKPGGAARGQAHHGPLLHQHTQPCHGITHRRTPARGRASVMPGKDPKKLMLASSGSDAAQALGGQGRLDVGAVIVRMPDGDLGEEPDPAVPGT